jgi:hypothetical protein
VVHDLQGVHKDETQADSRDLLSRHFDFNLGTAELLGFMGSCPNGASNRGCHCFQFAVRPDAHEHGQPVAQLYPRCSDGYTIPNGNCHPATQPYAASDLSANRNGDARTATQRTGAGDGFGISPHC